MPGSKSLNKAARSAERKRSRNRSTRSSVKTHISKAEKLIDTKSELAYQETVIAVSNIDKAVGKKVLHRNKGARLKSRVMKKLHDMTAVSPSAEGGEEETQQPE
jgi:small subunit ribosomal protein S20